MRWHHDAARDFIGFDVLQHTLRVELFHDDNRSTRCKHTHTRQRTRVIHRAHNDVCTQQGKTVLLQGSNVLVDVFAASKHGGWKLYTLWYAGGATGVHEVRTWWHIARWLVFRCVGNELVEGNHPCAHCTLRTPDHNGDGLIQERDSIDCTLEVFRTRKEQTCVGIFQDVGNFIGIQVKVHRNA